MEWKKRRSAGRRPPQPTEGQSDLQGRECASPFCSASVSSPRVRLLPPNALPPTASGAVTPAVHVWRATAPARAVRSEGNVAAALSAKRATSASARNRTIRAVDQVAEWAEGLGGPWAVAPAALSAAGRAALRAAAPAARSAGGLPLAAAWAVEAAQRAARPTAADAAAATPARRAHRALSVEPGPAPASCAAPGSRARRGSAGLPPVAPATAAAVAPAGASANPVRAQRRAAQVAARASIAAARPVRAACVRIRVGRGTVRAAATLRAPASPERRTWCAVRWA